MNNMMVGDKTVFAIESSIAQAYESEHFKALGFFVVYVQGHRYGIRNPEATMMGASHGEGAQLDTTTIMRE
jgi:hypothetical protein